MFRRRRRPRHPSDQQQQPEEEEERSVRERAQASERARAREAPGQAAAAKADDPATTTAAATAESDNETSPLRGGDRQTYDFFTSVVLRHIDDRADGDDGGDGGGGVARASTDQRSARGISASGDVATGGSGRTEEMRAVADALRLVRYLHARHRRHGASASRR